MYSICFLILSLIVSNAEILLPVNTFNSEWMKYIPDEVRLNLISMPGSHDTCASRSALRLGSSSRLLSEFWQTQVYNLDEQLESGVRFLDIRCRLINDVFTIHHGPIYLGMLFGDVLEKLEQFLLKSPSETIIMHVQEEYKAKYSSKSYVQVLFEYLDKYRRFLYIENKMPTLGVVRGRVVLSCPSLGLGVATRHEQNEWRTNQSRKKLMIETQLNACSNYSSFHLEQVDILCSNWINLSSNRWTSAFTLNQFVIDQLTRNVFDRVGIIVADFVSLNLIDKIIQVNFKQRGKVLWNVGNWAFNCHIPSNQSILIYHLDGVEYLDCLTLCDMSPNCTHFVWFDRVCSIRTGEVNRNDAIYLVDSVCGIKTVKWNGMNWANNCRFDSQHFAIFESIEQEMCAPTCASMSKCTHFTWHNRTCYLHTRSARKLNAQHTHDESYHCGLILRNDDYWSNISWKLNGFSQDTEICGNLSEQSLVDVYRLSAEDCVNKCRLDAECSYFRWSPRTCFLLKYKNSSQLSSVRSIWSMKNRTSDLMSSLCGKKLNQNQTMTGEQALPSSVGLKPIADLFKNPTRLNKGLVK